MADIPVYLIAGFLDGGKTNFINGILEDGFAREGRTLLICCEEGEEEYDPQHLSHRNCRMIPVEETMRLLAFNECKHYRTIVRRRILIACLNSLLILI